MTFLLRFLRQKSYLPIWQAMQRFTECRTKQTQDEIWFLEHPPVYTQGLAGKPEHAINLQEIPLVCTDRGGQITYHGPGQLIIYFLLDLERRDLNSRSFVILLENYLIELLSIWNISAIGNREAPGVYVDNKKIASIGLRILKKACYHGIALNVGMDLLPFSGINPCGHQNLKMIDMQSLIPKITLAEVEHEAQLLCKRYF